MFDDTLWENFHYIVEKNNVLNGELIATTWYAGHAYFVGEVDSPAPVPEPASLILFAMGALTIGRTGYRKRRARQNAAPSDSASGGI